MIDIAARIRARKIIEKILAQGLHRDDVDVDWPRSQDRAVNSIAFWLWTRYDDDSQDLKRFPEDSAERKILLNANAFLETSEPLPAAPATLVDKIRHLLSAGIEWRDCELPWHADWPFPERTNAPTPPPAPATETAPPAPSPAPPPT